MAPRIIAEITRSDLNTIETPSKALITDVKHLSSYNWIEAATPTIAVPGSPSVWSPLSHPRRLPKDSGLVYIAQNAARHPNSPLEPLFRALYVSEPSFDIRSTDVVSDRNNIRKLLSFVNPSSSRNGLETFSIRVEVMKDTVIFCREETATHEIIGRNEFKGFGHEFEKAYTKNKIEGSTGHHRIISYCFGGHNFIIRYETDGYVDNEAEMSPSNDAGLFSSLESMSLSSTDSPSAPAGPGSKLTVKKEGRAIPPNSTIEIKTRVHHKPIPVEEAAAQLWVSQTPKLVRAYHNHGTFLNPAVEDVRADITKWEKDNQAHLRKLAGLISKILSVMKGSDKGRSTILKYNMNGDTLVIQEAEEKSMLPEDLHSKWDGVNIPVADTSTESDAKNAPEIPTTPQVPADIPYLEIINYCVKNGYRHFFRQMPLSLVEYRVLFGALERCGVGVVQNQDVSRIMHDFRSAKDDYDPDERRQIQGYKDLARDAAFKLMYMFLRSEFGPGGGDKNKAYNAALFVVSHRAIFSYKTRKMVREAFDERFDASAKQAAALNNWPVVLPEGGASEGDVTTEEEFEGWYSSDSSW